jgi:hypothetical protein
LQIADSGLRNDEGDPLGSPSLQRICG